MTEPQQKDYEELMEQLMQEESVCGNCRNKEKGTAYCDGCGTHGNILYLETLMADMAGIT